MDPQLTRQQVWAGIGLSLAMTAIVLAIPLLHSAFHFLVTLNAHESGHALASNLGGRFCVPTPLGAAVSFSTERSLIFAAIEGGLFYLLFHYARRNGYVFASWIAAVALALIPVCYFLLSMPAFEQLTIWSGLAGELVFGAIFICSFFYPFPKRLNWKFNRFVVLPLAVTLLIVATVRWTNAIGDYEKMPWGGLWQGFAIDGDLNRLRDEFGWTPSEILRSYLFTAAICWTIVLGHFGYAFLSEESAIQPTSD